MPGMRESLIGSPFLCGLEERNENFRIMCVPSSHTSQLACRARPAEPRTRRKSSDTGAVDLSNRPRGEGIREQLFALPRGTDEPVTTNHRDGDHAHENAGAAFTRG